MGNTVRSFSDFSIIDKAKRIIISTRVQSFFLEKIFLISAEIIFFVWIQWKHYILTSWSKSKTNWEIDIATVFSKNLSLMLNINEEKENKWLWFKFKFIILVSIVLFVFLILFFLLFEQKKIHLTLITILKHTFSRHFPHDKYQGTSNFDKHLPSSYRDARKLIGMISNEQEQTTIYIYTCIYRLILIKFLTTIFQCIFLLCIKFF